MATRQQVEIALIEWKSSHHYLTTIWDRLDPLENSQAWALWTESRERDDRLRLAFDVLTEEYRAEHE